MARDEYLADHKAKKTIMKVFLNNAAGAMLSGKITDFDSETIILDKCLIERDKIISMVPQN